MPHVWHVDGHAHDAAHWRSALLRLRAAAVPLTRGHHGRRAVDAAPQPDSARAGRTRRSRAGGGGPADRDVLLLEGPRSRWSELRLVLSTLRDFITGFRGLHFVGPCVTVFGSARTPETHPAYAMARAVGAGLTRPRVHGDDRRRAGHHGSRQPRRARSRRPLGRLRHPAAQGAGRQPLPGSVRRLRSLLRPQDAAAQVLLRLRRDARRARHARRAVRGADADPDRQDPQLPRRPDGRRLLGAAARPARRDGARADHRSARPRPAAGHRRRRGWRSPTSTTARWSRSG